MRRFSGILRRQIGKEYLRRRCLEFQEIALGRMFESKMESVQA